MKKLKSEGSSIRAIAKYLDRNPSTISRELKRNKGKNGVYHPVTAQKLYSKRRDNCGKKIIINSEVLSYINDKIKKNWSPEQIYNRSLLINNKLEIPSFSTIYRWIHLGLIINGDMKKLRRKGKFKRPQETRGRFNIGKTIKKRPKSVYKREEIGHWRPIQLSQDDTEPKEKVLFV